MKQFNLTGFPSLVEMSIARLREFEPPAGYYGAFSGGKDSITIKALAVMAGVQVDWHYHQTGIDPPELVQFIRQHHPDVDRITQHPGIWRLVEKKGLPRRQGRWCCEMLKEHGGGGRVVITGVRWAESARRKNRRIFEACRKDGTKWYLNPIIDWTTKDVWEFIRGNALPYCKLYDEGFKRLGCVLCPMHGPVEVAVEQARWPKLSEAWRRAALRYWERQTDGGKKFPDGDSFFQWWLTRKGHDDKDQCVMFE
jgi:phosphoadenosine phosphosulfate reductase